MIANESIRAHKALISDFLAVSGSQKENLISSQWNPNINGLTASGLTPQSQKLLANAETSHAEALQSAYKIGLKNYS